MYGGYNNGGQQGGGSSGGFYGGGGGFNQQQDQSGGYGAYGGNTNQWQQPQQSDPMQGGYGGYGGQQQQQQQQQQAQPALFNPALAAMAGSISGDAVVEMGKGFITSRAAQMVPGLESGMLLLRSYFAVDNNYVKTKMLKVLFPFRSKNWKRVVSIDY